MVSVIIPVYNGEQFLGECLDSVIGQSYRNLDIIIVDDGSTDGSHKICQKYAEKDGRIRLIHQENAGVSAARNRGLSIAQGDYIVFVDADDKLTYRAVELLRKNAECGIDLVVGSHEEFRGRKGEEIIRDSELIDLDKNIDALPRIAKTLTTPWGKLFLRKYIVENGLVFNHELPYGEDTVFNWNYCECKVRRIHIIEDVVYLYRKGGIASSLRYYPDINLLSLQLLKAYVELLKSRSITFNIEDEIWQRIKACSWHYVINCSYSNAIKKICETVDIYIDFVHREKIYDINERKILCDFSQEDAKRLVLQFYKDRYKSLILKKGKLLLYRISNRRI